MISIIIPTYNESENISNILNHLLTSSYNTQHIEIICVDGGSTDNTTAIIKDFTLKHLNKLNISLFNSKKGRAIQMNLGAKKANGNILYFLHADSFPPKHFDKYILNANTKAGCFKLKFNNKHWWLSFVSWFTKFNWSFCRGGDQSLFITKTLFRSLNGFNEAYLIYEDNIFIKKLYKRKVFSVINLPIISSARHYEKYGVWNIQWLYLKIHLRHKMGASAEELYKIYTGKFS